MVANVVSDAKDEDEKMNEIQTTQADRLKQLHGEIIGAARMLIGAAIEAGGILQDVKAALRHGDFETWIADNLSFTPRTARNYMRIFRERDKIKTEIVSDLTGAYKMLTAATLTKGRQERAEEREEQAAQRGLALEVRRKEAKLGIGMERPWRAFIRTNTGRDEIEICIARGPDEENRKLETADFVVPKCFVDEVPKTTPTLEVINHVQRMALDGSAICTQVGFWGDCRIPSGGHFIDSWAVVPKRVDGVKRSGWFMTGNEHGFPADWFCEALLHPTEQELKEIEKEAAVRELNSLYEDRENLEKKIERCEAAAA